MKIMDNKEQKISNYIDVLNQEKKPEEHNSYSFSKEDQEMEELMTTVRRIRSLKEPEMPGEEFSKNLVTAIEGGEEKERRRQVVKKERNRKTGNRKNIWFTSTIAAVLCIAFFLVQAVFPLKETSIVYAMEKAYENINAYHGTLEIKTINGLGEKTLQRTLEVWIHKNGTYYVKELEGINQNLVTVNNGEKKWQIREEEKKYYLYGAFPDTYFFELELEHELNQVKDAKEINTVGEETIAGRKALKVEVKPKGGEPYYLWIDKETDLPLQKQGAEQNGLMYLFTYTSMEYLKELPLELMTYHLPEGYEEVTTSHEQLVSTLGEVEEMTGFIPRISDEEIPNYKISSFGADPVEQTSFIYYQSENGKKTVISQRQSSLELTPDSMAILGKVKDKDAEIIKDAEGSSIRWMEEGFEYKVEGNISLEELIEFVNPYVNGEVTVPETESAEPSDEDDMVKVPVNLEVEEGDQKNADAGHSPWKLDPAYVAQVFVSLQIHPEGITGDYPIAYEDIAITENDGIRAVAEIKDKQSPSGKVYLERLIRQDSTGIWTVVGYEPMGE